jgi:heat shock protein HtpX
MRRARLSPFERHALLIGAILTAVAFPVAWSHEETGGLARAIASYGLAAVVVSAASRGLRLYVLGMRASLPTSVARIPVRVHPPRLSSLSAVVLGLLLPLAAIVSVLVLVKWAWMVLAAVLLFGGIGMMLASESAPGDHRRRARASATASALLDRLCMRADIRAPELVVERGGLASAWTTGGRIHVTTALLDLLDEAELEAVLAHELAHLARRDAAVMEMCSAPSRFLLAFVGFLTPRLARWLRRSTLSSAPLGIPIALVVLTVLAIPSSFVIGWISRLAVLGMSRARELAADAGAAALTGRPSALASALLKLDRQREWAPRADLRQAYPNAVLCVVGTQGRWLGRLFATHPPTALRVRRLEELEGRLQAGPYARTLL